MIKLILLGLKLTNQNHVHEENKSRLIPGNTSYIPLSIIHFSKAQLWFKLMFFSFFPSYTAPTTLLNYHGIDGHQEHQIWQALCLPISNKWYQHPLQHQLSQFLFVSTWVWAGFCVTFTPMAAMMKTVCNYCLHFLLRGHPREINDSQSIDLQSILFRKSIEHTAVYIKCFSPTV